MQKVMLVAGLILFTQATFAETAPETAVTPVKPQGSVSRSAFTLGIKQSEPQDNLLTLGNRKQKVYYFTELKNLAGQKIVHRWEFAGKVIAEVPFEVKGSRWRVWSSKTLLPEWLGEWKVSVVDGDGKVLVTDSFTYTSAN